MSGNGPAFLEGGGLSADKIRCIDWSRTDLGPLDDWPAALKTVVGLMLGSRFPKALVWGPSLTTIYNDAFAPILGDKPEAMGRPFNEVWSEAWNSIGPIADKAFAGEATFIENFPLTINRHGYDEEAHFTFCYSPVRDEHGRVCGFMDTVIETSETVQAQRDVAAMNHELCHRMRNLVAMATALASQTFRGDPGVEGKLETFLERLRALGGTQALLAAEQHPDATIDQLVEMILAGRVTDRDRVHAEGPSIALKGRKALSLSLALNELLTNSIKYGALSQESGRVGIRWQRDEDDFTFFWRECGGPPVSQPHSTGFGTKLIERFVASHFNGEARIEFRPEGVEYHIRSKAAVLDQ